MTTNDWLQLALYTVVLTLIAPPLGAFMARVLEAKPTWLSPVLGPLERTIYRLGGVDPARETTWKTYAVGMLLVNAAGLLVVYGLQRAQALLPLNPQHLAAVAPHLAFNTAASFATNTNWQSYAGEATLSPLVQMLGLTVQNFLSAATGIAVFAALARGFSRRSAETVGNFWADLTRSTLYILLPLSFVLALLLVSQGSVQTLAGPHRVPLLQPTADANGKAVAEQTVVVGPVASQIAIKQLGTNGGGYYNVNSAHPFENPTPLSNFLEMLAILVISAGLCFTFGLMVRDRRQGVALYAAMLVLFLVFAVLCIGAEQAGNPKLAALGADQHASLTQPGGNMEGKETRFGIVNSAIWATATTCASNGSVNAMHDSFTPLGGFVPLVLIQLGEVVFGGVGSGLYGMLMFALTAVFISGLMVGRTPEYLGKKIEAFEMKMASLVILIPPITLKLGTAVAVALAAGRAGILNPGPHGFSEILYAFSSAANNNGSAFAGLTASTPFYDLGLGLAMLLGRYWLAIPTLAIAGSLAAKKKVPAGPGTLPTHTPLFVFLLISVVLIVGALAFFPALALGPIVEHLLLGELIVAKPKAQALFEPAIVRRAIVESVKKLDPRVQIRNPVMFVVLVTAVGTTILWVQALVGHGEASPGFILAVSIWLWFTVVFANFAEAMAEGRGKAQADALRRARSDVFAKKLDDPHDRLTFASVPATMLRKGDHVLVAAGDIIPIDSEVIEGVASVDESVITGESAPVIRESGGDRSAVTGGTRILSDWLVLRVASDPGETFLDRMIAMVEGAKRQRTPNEIALHILLAALTLVFLLTTGTLLPFSIFSVHVAGSGTPITVTALAALLVCLIPTTIGGLLSAIGIAGMDRLTRDNVVAMSGRAVEAAGDVDVLLLDKTGTITLGNRQATEFLPAPGVEARRLADSAQLASLSDETPEGRSIVVLAKQRFDLRERDVKEMGAQFIPFTAQTRMSGADLNGRQVRKGAADAIERFVGESGGRFPDAVRTTVESIARNGATPLVVSDGSEVLGVIQLKDVVKGGIRERFGQLRRMGIKTIMITGDNPLTAAAIAAEAGVDDFLAEATPEAKLKLIREQQAGGRLVAMTGDGTNDAPALAQADVAVAMNSGTQAAKEAGNMVDLDSNPTKLIEIVETGKQMLMTRGALTTFSVANDVAKYFAILPAAFATTYPVLGALNIMRLHSPESAILSAVIFNALIIIALVPLALKGVRYRPLGAAAVLRNNLLIYGVGGIVAPFLGIKAIDLILTAFFGG